MEGEVVISSSKDNSIYIWEPQSLTVLSTFTENVSTSKQSLVFSDNTLISAQGSKTILHYYAFGKEGPDKKSGVLEEITALATYSHLLIGGSIHGNLFLWDLNTGSLYLTWPAHLRKVTYLLLSDYIISTSEDASIKIFRTSSVLQGNLSVHKEISLNVLPITGISLKGPYLFTCSSDKSLSIFETWELKQQKFFSSELTCLEVAENLSEIFIGTETGSVLLFKSNKVWEIDQKRITNIRFTLSERFLLISTQKIFVVVPETGEKIKTFVMHLSEVMNVLCVPRPQDFVAGSGSSKSMKPVRKTVENEPGLIQYCFTQSEKLQVAETQPEPVVKSDEELEKLRQMNSILYRLWVEHCS